MCNILVIILLILYRICLKTGTVILYYSHLVYILHKSKRFSNVTKFISLYYLLGWGCLRGICLTCLSFGLVSVKDYQIVEGVLVNAALI